MPERSEQSGFPGMWIILLGLLALSAVLLDGIAITLQKAEAERSRERSGREIAVSYCGRPHERHPETCSIAEVYHCDSHFLLRTTCPGVGDVVLDSDGHYLDWCGYNSLDGPAPTCSRYVIQPDGAVCTQTTNLCLTQ